MLMWWKIYFAWHSHLEDKDKVNTVILRTTQESSCFCYSFLCINMTAVSLVYQACIVCTPSTLPPPCPANVRGGVWNFGIWGFGGRSKYFRFQGRVVVLWGESYFVGGGQFILHPFSYFEIQDLKNSKRKFACDALIFNIRVFRYKVYLSYKSIFLP